jgi:hypothetical protein
VPAGSGERTGTGSLIHLPVDVHVHRRSRSFAVHARSTCTFVDLQDDPFTEFGPTLNPIVPDDGARS